MTCSRGSKTAPSKTNSDGTRVRAGYAPSVMAVPRSPRPVAPPLWDLLFAVVLVVSCGCDNGNDDDRTPGPALPDDVACIIGELGCDCRGGNECDPGLICNAGTCETDPDATPPEPSESSDTGGTATATGDDDDTTTGDGDTTTGEDDTTTSADPDPSGTSA